MKMTKKKSFLIPFQLNWSDQTGQINMAILLHSLSMRRTQARYSLLTMVGI